MTQCSLSFSLHLPGIHLSLPRAALQSSQELRRSSFHLCRAHQGSVTGPHCNFPLRSTHGHDVHRYNVLKPGSTLLVKDFWGSKGGSVFDLWEFCTLKHVIPEDFVQRCLRGVPSQRLNIDEARRLGPTQRSDCQHPQFGWAFVIFPTYFICLSFLSEKFRVRESVRVCRLCNTHGFKNWQTLRLPDQCCHLLQLICNFCSLWWKGWGAVFGDDRCSMIQYDSMFKDFYDLTASSAFVEHDNDRLMTEPVDWWELFAFFLGELFPLKAYTGLLWDFFVTAYYLPSALLHNVMGENSRLWTSAAFTGRLELLDVELHIE